MVAMSVTPKMPVIVETDTPAGRLASRGAGALD